jgi:bacterial/archaeal transporter family-2 protein
VMKMTWVLLLLAFVAGMCVPVQFGVNAQLRNVVGGPAAATAISFFVGTIAALIVAVFILRESLPEIGSVSDAPWWVWTGGLLGVVYVLASILLTPQLGSAATIGFILAGQVAASILIDHFGFLRIPIHELSLPRLIGAVLIVVGVAVVQRF